jgi:tRNA(fMet)-specific endonuclease VapC
MPLWILDTDCLTLFQTRNTAMLDRIQRIPPEQLATTIVSAEEQMRGRLLVVRRSENQQKLSRAYSYLQEAILFFQTITVLAFTPEAETIYWQLKAQKIRPGSRDLRIASIALSLDATVVTRNRQDFQQVPNLKLADWSG